MRLIAMMTVHNELDRYLKPVVEHLQDFCDEVRILDDGSTDGTPAWLMNQRGVSTLSMPTSGFYEHEGHTRQRLLEWTMEGDPSHILALDGDEFVSDGRALRSMLAVENQSGVWGLNMQEIWKADDRFLSIREDHAWHSHTIGICFAVPDLNLHRQSKRSWRIPERALACGRVPTLIVINANRTGQGFQTGLDILHFGWANENDRDARYQRYVTHDGGKHHDNKHLESIMWDDSRVKLVKRDWPSSIDKATVLKRALR